MHTCMHDMCKQPFEHWLLHALVAVPESTLYVCARESVQLGRAADDLLSGANRESNDNEEKYQLAEEGEN